MIVIPSDITEYITVLLTNIYDRYNFAATSKQIYDSLGEYRRRHWMIGNIVLKSVFISLAEATLTNSISINCYNCRDIRHLLGANICRNGLWLIVVANKEIKKWLECFTSLNMFTEDIDSNVLCATMKYRKHWNYVVNDAPCKIINRTIITNTSNISIILKNVYTDRYSLLADTYSSNNYVPRIFNKNVLFEPTGLVSIVKGRRTYSPTIKYIYVTDSGIELNLDKKILVIGRNIGGFKSVDEFNRSASGVICCNYVHNSVFPDIILNYTFYNKKQAYIRSYTDSDIPMYMICDNDINTLNYRIFGRATNTVKSQDNIVRLIFICLMALNINILNLTNYDIDYIKRCLVFNKKMTWSKKNSSLTPEQVKILSVS